MKKSETIIEISKALLSIQKEIQSIPKNAENPFYHSKYVTLDDLLEIVKPICNKYGVTIVQDIEGLTISTMLLHESGEWLQQEGLLLPNEKGTAQSAGSAVTYGRRYSLSAILGIATEEDDDGNAAQKGKGNNQNNNYQSQNSNNKNSIDFNAVMKELKDYSTIEEIEKYHTLLLQEYPNLTDKQKGAIDSIFNKRRSEI